MMMTLDVVAILLRLLNSSFQPKKTLYGVSSINFSVSRIVSLRAGRDVLRIRISDVKRPSLCQRRLED
jgi:hypothetical protein